MKNIKTLAMGLIIVVLSGCQTAPMTARSRLDVGGEIVVVEETTTINPDGTRTVRIVKTSKSPAAGDLEIKNNEITGRTKVGATIGGFFFNNNGGGVSSPVNTTPVLRTPYGASGW